MQRFAEGYHNNQVKRHFGKQLPYRIQASLFQARTISQLYLNGILVRQVWHSGKHIRKGCGELGSGIDDGLLLLL